jgi:hypothetical protein
MANEGIQDSRAFKLTVSIVELIWASGITRQEATVVVKAAGALIPEMQLPEKPTLEL